MQTTERDEYGSNAFRVLGLNVNATGREVRVRADELRMRVALNGGTATELEAIRAAPAALDDPVRRLTEELYWIHLSPDPVPSGIDPADSPELRRAIASLTVRAKQGSDEALHDLAVLRHAAAIASGDGAVGLWRVALTLWRDVWKSEPFWLRMRLRAEAAADPRVSDATISALREGLPPRVLASSARAAARLLESGDDAQAAQHLAAIRESGFPDDAIREACGSATAGLRARLRAAIADKRERLAHTDGSGGVNNQQYVRTVLCDIWQATQLDVVPLIERLLQVDPEDSNVQVTADEAAELIQSVAVRLHNEANDSDTAVLLLALGERLAVSQSARGRASQNRCRLRRQMALGRAMEHGTAGRWDQGITSTEEALQYAADEEERQEALQVKWGLENAREQARARTRKRWIGAAVVVALILAIWMLSSSTSSSSRSSPPPPPAKVTGTSVPASVPRAQPSTSSDTTRSELRARINRLKTEIDGETSSIDFQESRMRAEEGNLGAMRSRLENMDNQYRYSKAPPALVAEFERLRSQYNQAVEQHNWERSRLRERIAAFNSKVDEHNELVARLRAMR